MSDKPILFSAPMVRALLAGAKTQTRRMIKPQPVVNEAGLLRWKSGRMAAQTSPDGLARLMKFSVGDRLYVRETWAHYQTVNHIRRYHGGASSEVSDGLAGYRADGHDTIEDFRKHVRLMSDLDLEAVEINGDRWRPSIHMPRWASRITLTVTDVRVQRLQDISEEDAIAEGIAGSPHGNNDQWVNYPIGSSASGWTSPIDSYRTLWNAINGPGSWDANPWVAAYTFTVALGNIDQIARAA